jgi:glycosyltransferase involved in cell wall biosynthesis
MSEERSVCFFGIYDPTYARSRVLSRGFTENGFRVVACRVDARKFRGIAKYIELYKQYRQVRHEHFSYVLVLFPGHSVVWLARILFGKKIIFDAFVSLYDSNVLDRKLYRAASMRALRDRALDYISARLAWRVLMDTQTHSNYYARHYRLDPRKFVRVFVGVDEKIFYPREDSLLARFTLHFHGRYIPLHGVSYILQAAKLLANEPVYFRLIGSGQERVKMEALARTLRLANVEFIDDVPLAELPIFIAQSQVCLGIFGDSLKTQHVIPNKVYEYAAMGKPSITADTPAIRELFNTGKNVLLCNAANAEDLAAAIMQLYYDAPLRKQLGKEAYMLSHKMLTPKSIVAKLLQQL